MFHTAVLARARRPVELVGDVVVHVVDDQVRVAAVVHANERAVLQVPLEHGVRRDGGVLQVALVGVGVDDDVDLRRAVAVDDVVGDAVEVAVVLVVLAEVGMQPAVALLFADDVVDDRRRVGGDRGVGDRLVPRVVGGEERVAQQGRHGAVFQGLDGQGDFSAQRPRRLCPGSLPQEREHDGCLCESGKWSTARGACVPGASGVVCGGKGHP